MIVPGGIELGIIAIEKEKGKEKRDKIKVDAICFPSSLIGFSFTLLMGV